MSEDKVTESRPVDPMVVTVVGTGDGSRLPSGTEAETPGSHQPNLITLVVPPLLAVMIRAVNTFLSVWLGLVLGGMATDVIPATDFLELAGKCAGLTLAGVVIGVAKDFVTIFTKLEQKYPLLTGNV